MTYDEYSLAYESEEEFATREQNEGEAHNDYMNSQQMDLEDYIMQQIIDNKINQRIMSHLDSLPQDATSF